LKYNLITLARYLEANFAITGNIGKTLKGSNGTLYQFHKDYNYDVTNPNTVFNINKSATDVDTGEGFSAEFSDNKEFPYKMIKNRADYGIDEKLPKNSRFYNSEDVYLSASGEWRYKFDRVRVPVLESLF